MPYISIACNSGETNLTQCNYSPCGYGHVGVQCIGNRMLNVVYCKCACVCALVIQKISILYWRAREASKTLSGVYKFELVQYMYIYMYGGTCARTVAHATHM